MCHTRYFVFLPADNSYSDFDVIHSKERFGHYIVLSCKESRLPYKVLWQKDGSNMSSYVRTYVDPDKIIYLVSM